MTDESVPLSELDAFVYQLMANKRFSKLYRIRQQLQDIQRSLEIIMLDIADLQNEVATNEVFES